MPHIGNMSGISFAGENSAGAEVFTVYWVSFFSNFKSCPPLTACFHSKVMQLSSGEREETESVC